MKRLGEVQRKSWPREKQAIVDVFKLVPEMEFWFSIYLFYWPSSGARMGDRNCTVIVTL
jgi:hypothetical protein